MLHGQRLAVVVPAYNTSRRVLDALRTMPSFVDRVIVVDDASTDDTPAWLARCEDPRVQVHRHPNNRGVGGALVTGYRLGLADGADLVAVMAGDGQMHPDDLGPLCEPVALGRADYAKGNRLRSPGCLSVMPWTRWAGNQVLSLLTRVATGLWHLSDSQCGYTVASRRVLAALDLERLWSRYGYPNHLLGALSLAGFRVEDVTVRPVYAGERSGVRLRDALVTVPRIVWWVACARWRRARLTDGARTVLDLARASR